MSLEKPEENSDYVKAFLHIVKSVTAHGEEISTVAGPLVEDAWQLEAEGLEAKAFLLVSHLLILQCYKLSNSLFLVWKMRLIIKCREEWISYMKFLTSYLTHRKHGRHSVAVFSEMDFQVITAQGHWASRSSTYLSSLAQLWSYH